MPNVTVYVISKQWADLPSKTTPIFAADMTHIEQGIKNVTEFVNTLNAEAGLYLCAAPFTLELADKLDGIEANANNYSLPTASTSTKGGVKVDGVTITINSNGVISAVGGGGGSSTISGLTDVQLNQLADGEILKWDAENSKWVNASEGGGGGASEISELDDVDLTNLADGEILKWDAENSKWVNSVITGGSAYTKELVYDSGSWSTYAPYNTDVSFIKSIAEFDQLLFIVASPDDDATNKMVRSALIVDKDSVTEWGYFTFYMTRTLRLVDITNTTFNYYSDVNPSVDRDKQLCIYKIYGIKFGGGSSVEPPTYNETMDILEGE